MCIDSNTLSLCLCGVVHTLTRHNNSTNYSIYIPSVTVHTCMRMLSRGVGGIGTPTFCALLNSHNHLPTGQAIGKNTRLQRKQQLQTLDINMCHHQEQSKNTNMRELYGIIHKNLCVCVCARILFCSTYGTLKNCPRATLDRKKNAPSSELSSISPRSSKPSSSDMAVDV